MKAYCYLSEKSVSFSNVLQQVSKGFYHFYAVCWFCNKKTFFFGLEAFMETNGKRNKHSFSIEKVQT